MTSTGTCPQCGTLLFSDAAAGLCPRCLGALGFLGEDGDEVSARGALRPHRLGDYELIEEIARGGMGVVYKARQVSLNRIVAVKVVLHGPFSSPQFAQRFRTEASVVAGLQHPNIVAIHEVGQAGDDQFFSMEYIEGKSLADLVREKPLSARRAAEYLKTIAQAVQYAHEHGVLHRDLKPSNVLLDVFGEPRITDFGLAKLLDSDVELTTTGQVLGSPAFIAPEQATGKLSEVRPASDIYSLGAILYHLLTGRPPFQGETLPEILLQVQNVEPVSPRRLNPSVPVDLQTICLKCLQKDATRRYDSARELAADLGRFLGNEPIQARAVTVAERLWLWSKRRPTLAALIAALNLVLLLGIGGVLWQWRRAEAHARGEREQRQVAEASAEQMRLNLYAGDVSFAAQAVHRGNLGQARLTLASLEPKAGEQDLRGFEWRYLWSQCQGDQLATLGEHDWIVTCAAFSADGKFLATGSQDATVKVWDVARRELVTTLNVATGDVWSVTFTPDERFLVTSGLGGTRLWEYGSWREHTNFPGISASLAKSKPLLAVTEANLFYWWQPPGSVSVWNYLTGEKLLQVPKPGRAIALSPDGTMLAVGDRPRGIDLWDVASGQLIRTLATSNSAWSISFSADGKQLLTLAGAQNLLLWDLTGEPTVRRVSSHSMSMWSAIFSPDGKTIATVSSDQTLRLTDTATLEVKEVLRGHGHEVWSVAFSPDGQLLATGGKDQKVMLWSGEAPKRSLSVPHQGIMRPSFSPDGKLVLTWSLQGSELANTLWNLRDGSLATRVAGARAMAFTPDGRQVVRWSVGNSALELVSIETGEVTPVALEGVGEQNGGLQYRSCTADWRALLAVDALGQVGIWETVSGKLIKRFQGPPSPISVGALSPDGRFVALGEQRESIVHLYDHQSGRAWQLKGHKDTIRGLAFSPDSATLASGSLDGRIRLWNVETRALQKELPGHMEETSDVAFSPDGRTFASINLRNSVKLWHVATGRELVSWESPHVGGWVRFSPDGRFLAVTTQTNSVQFFEAAPVPEASASP